MYVCVFTLACFLVVTPTSIDVQIVFAAAALGAAVLLAPLARRPLPRLVLLTIAALVMVRYLGWRYGATLPGTDDLVSFSAAVALLAAETWMIVIFLLSALMMADPLRRTTPVALPGSDVDLPSIDVLVPSLNEPESLLAITLAAAKRLDYPADKLTVVLCDDGGTDQRCADPDPIKAAAARRRRERLSKLCADLGVVYCTRPTNAGAKAGNLNEALMRVRGELVAIFDADHAPTPDFLKRTVGHFAHDERLFLVQTPHLFLNPDPIARNTGMAAYAPPENEMFYGQLHDGLSRWHGAFFCGSAALLRRSALDEVGGISGETITEDAETALELHARGWRSLYVNHAMIAGLQPETFGSMIGQRGRWATGMIQILLLKNPLFRRGLSLGQRLCYLNSMAFWFFPLTRMIMLAAPLTYIFFDIELFETTRAEALAYMLGYIGVSLVAQYALFSRTRWPFQSEVYEVAQTPYLLRAVLGTIWSPRGATFRVTAKDELVQKDRLSEIARPLFLLLLLVACGVAMAGWRWVTEPGNRETLELVGAWAIFNLVLVGAALGALVDRRQRRSAPRVETLRPARLRIGDSERELEGRIVDVSTGGAAIELLPGSVEGAPAAGIPVRISIDDHLGRGEVSAETVGYRLANGAFRLRVAFARKQSREGAMTQAALVHASSAAWQERRARECRALPVWLVPFWPVWLALTGLVSAGRALLFNRESVMTQNAAPAFAPEADVPELLARRSSTNVNGVAATRLAETLAGPVEPAPGGGKMAGTAAAVWLAALLSVVPLQGFGQSVPLPETEVAPTASLSWPSGVAPLPGALHGGVRGAVTLPPMIDGTTLNSTRGAARGTVPLPAAQAGPTDSDIPTTGSGVIPVPGGFSTEPFLAARGARADLVTLPLRSQRGASSAVRLLGERDRAEALLILPPGARPDRLSIAVQSSAFVLPELSRMRVVLNGAPLAVVPLEQISGQETVEFDIPPALPLGVRNVVGIEVVQTHRLSCGATASFDLWTEVDLAASGAAVARDSLETRSLSAALARIAASASEGVPVRTLAGPSDAAALGMAGAREMAAALGQIVGGPIRFVPADDRAPLVEFTTGIQPAIVATDGGVRIVLGRDGSADPSTLLEAAGAAPGALDGPAARAVPALALGEAIELRSLGMASGVVTMRRATIEVPFGLPSTFLPTGGERAQLFLDYAHLPDLPEGSILRVQINGETVQSTSLVESDLVRHRNVPVTFDATRLGAGTNVLGFEVVLGGANEQAICPGLNRTFVEIDPSSRLLVQPTSAFAPGTIGAMLSDLAPSELAVGLDVNPFAPGGTTAERLDAMALASALETRTRAWDDPGAGPLRIVASTGLDRLPLGPYAPIRSRLAEILDPQAWAGFDAAPDADTATTAPDGTTTEPVPGETGPSAGPSPSDPFARPAQRLFAPESEPAAAVTSPSVVVRGDAFGDLLVGLRPYLARFDAALHEESLADLDAWLSARLPLDRVPGEAIILSRLDTSAPATAHLVVGERTAPETAAMALAQAQAQSGRLNGHFAVWTPDEGWTVWTDATRLPALLEPLSLENLHEVAGVYADRRPILFLAAVMALGLVAAAIASATLVAGRRAL